MSGLRVYVVKFTGDYLNEMKKENMGVDCLGDIGSPELGPVTRMELLVTFNGGDLNLHRAEQSKNMEVEEEARKYMNMDPSEWPSLEFKWDFRKEAQRFALDGIDLETFVSDYPQGLCLGWILLSDFDEKLDFYNRRELKDLWTVGDRDKLCKAIAYIRRGELITPPLVAPLLDRNRVCLAGGNHRYTVAKFSGQEKIPIYFDPNDAGAISTIVPVRHC